MSRGKLGQLIEPLCAVVLLATLGAPATGTIAQPPLSGKVTVWSWNIAAEALRNLVPAFNKQYPNIQVDIVNMGHSDLHDRSLAACAAGGGSLPDVVTIENQSAEQYWQQFPECFKDLNTLGYGEISGGFPNFTKTALTVGNKAYAVPWDAGPSAVFYRRDIFERAGIDANRILTWRDFIAAGKKLRESTDGKVAMIQDDKGGDDALFRQLAVQNGCSFFSNDGAYITITQTGCAEALDTVKLMWDAGIMSSASWDQKIESFKAGLTATEVYGGWYEGTIRANAPDQRGKWGMFALPAFKVGGRRASNTGGSALAISATSKNPQAAYAFVSYALGTTDGQLSMLEYRGLVPALLAAANHTFVSTPQPYWGGQAVWADLLKTMNDMPSFRPTRYYLEATNISTIVFSDYLDGKYSSASAALKAVADQLASSTGLPVSK